jgi:arylsulfatase A-like enzyme
MPSSLFTRREFLQASALGAASAAMPGRAAAAAPRRPNIVFMLVDDLGWSDLGCYGNTFHETPRIDRFAASAARFTHAYAACAVCSPTRASILTGKYPARLAMTDWIPGEKHPEKALALKETIRQGRYKLMRFYETGARELYDLGADPGESRNLATSLPDKTRQLETRLDAWLKQVGAYIPVRQ